MSLRICCSSSASARGSRERGTKKTARLSVSVPRRTAQAAVNEGSTPSMASTTLSMACE